jgi:2'-5' RNA ligase
MQNELENMLERISRRRLFAAGTVAFLGLDLFTAQKSAAQSAEHIEFNQPTLTNPNDTSTELEYYNLALRPRDESLSKTLTDLAQTNLADRPAGYLLGNNNALPHVTVCQFKAQSNQINEIWRRAISLKNTTVELYFSHLYISQDKKDAGLLWIGLAMKGQAALSRLQEDVFNMLAKAGIKGTTLPEEYFPHVTWARCRADLPLSFKILPELALYTTPQPFILTFGQSNDIGVYSKQILPSPY